MPFADSPARMRALGGVSLCLALAYYAALAWTFRQYTADDAFIYFRYAENLAGGHGLVFNIGERVYGNTSLLWTALLALAVAGGLPVVGFAKIAGTVAGAMCILVVHRIARQLGPREAVLAPLLVVGFIELPYWAVSGMDTSVYAAVCALALLLTLQGLHARSPAWAAAAWALAGLTRPEGVLIGALAVGYLLWARRTDRVRQLLLTAAVFLVPLLAWLVFAWWYFGDPIPTTYWAKRLDRWTAFHRASIFLRAFVTANDGALMALTCAAALAHPTRRTVRVVGALVLVNVAIVLWTGGDSWGSRGVFRFATAWLVPLAILMAAGLTLVLDRLSGAGGRTLAGVAALAVVAAWLTFPSIRAPGAPSGGEPAIVSHLQTHSSRSDRLAVTDIGQFGYLTGLPVFDMYGLVEPWVARELRKESPTAYSPADNRRLIDRVFEVDPRWIILKGTADERGVALAPELAGPALFAEPRFQARYRLIVAGKAAPYLLFERSTH